MTTAAKKPAFAPFAWPDFRRLFVATACATTASRALAVVLGYKVYELTGDPLALGGLGLVEAIPSVGLALFGGHVADRVDRRSILRVTLAATEHTEVVKPSGSLELNSVSELTSA